MSYAFFTRTGAVNTGYRNQLSASVGKLSVTNNTASPIYLKIGSGTYPALPTNAYIPGAGAEVAVIAIPAGITRTFGEDYGPGFQLAVQEAIDWLAWWQVAAGDVVVVGH
jgi:hypothetical protein